MKNLLIALFIILTYSKGYSQKENKDFEIIDTHIKNKEYNKSLLLVNELLAKDSLNFEYHLKSAEIKEYQNKLLDSQKSLEKALKLSPNSAKVYEKICFFYYKHQSFENAINNCNTGLNLKDIDLESKNFLYFIKAESFFATNKLKEAIDLYKIVLNNNPIEFVETLSYISIAKSYVKLNQNDDAIFYLENCLKKYPDFVVAINNLAFRYNAKENYTKSIELFERGLKISLKFKPNEDKTVNLSDKITITEGSDKITIALILNNMGYAKHKLKRNEEALIDVTKSIELYPENSYAFRNLALINIGLNKMDDACSAIQKAKSLGFVKQFGDEILELEKTNCK